MSVPARALRPGGRLADKDAVDDLVMLDQIREDKIVDCLKNRYMKDMIYTNVGPVLIAINPFKMIAALYTDARIREYKGKKAYELPPHVYALADDAYSSMINYRENQCVIISGESGSGKTETSKIIMQYISGVSGKSAEVVRVKERMLSSNPILEGFGNAKTVNNNNSSRFGKYMEILFDLGGDPVGGRVTNYLLEKSRVVGPGQTERNFHVFYQVCCGASQQERQHFCIESVQYFYYLSQTNCFTVPGIDDANDYKEMTEALAVVGITELERQEVLRVVSAVLWLGNVAFIENSAEVSQVQDRQVLDIVAGLLQVNGAALEAALCTRKIQTGIGAKAEVFTKPSTAAQADFCRDTLAKALYTKLFDWLVLKINESIRKDGHQGIQIGVLDIYGFEIFQYNSFEQLCINFVNEKLQQIFIELTLKAEQEEYAAEGIPWKDIEYNNNKPLCDLIENKPGLLTICDDCCHTAKSDQMYVMDLKSFFSGNPYIHCGVNDFTIRHYAGDVRYESTNFLTKNKDTLFDDLILVMKSSKCAFARDQGWYAIEVSEGQKKKPITVGAQFGSQVSALMKALRACVPHYVRCIKPNSEKVPNQFDRENITRQVRYLGLLENVKVRRAGYAHRSLYDRFLNRYKLLSRAIWNGQVRGDARQLCQKLCTDIGWQQNREYALGKTKIFIQEATVLFGLEDMLDRKVNDAVVTIQKAYRKYKQRRFFLEMRADAYELVNMRKERRRGSVSREYKGDYLDFTYNKLVLGLLTIVGGKEKVLFADRGNFIVLNGPKGFFASVFGKKDMEPPNPRLILLSDKALYSFIFELDPTTNQTKAKLFYRVPTLQIASITLSSLADNYFIIHFSDAAQQRDVLQSCRRKTELLQMLNYSCKQQGRAQGISINWIGPWEKGQQPESKDTICVNPEKKRFVEIRWVRDDTVDPNTDRLERIKHNVVIHVPSGVPQNQIQAPFRPAKIDMSVGRPSLKALYDCPGNGVDELSFRAGDIIFIIQEELDGWYQGELNGKKGYVPATYVERIKKNNPNAGAKKGPAMNKGGAKPAVTTKWQELETETGDKYYYHPETGESVWDPPAEWTAAQNAAKSAAARPVYGGATAVTAGRRPSQENEAKNKCAQPGCTNNKFGGAYCVSHAKPAAGAGPGAGAGAGRGAGTGVGAGAGRGAGMGMGMGAANGAGRGAAAGGGGMYGGGGAGAGAGRGAAAGGGGMYGGGAGAGAGRGAAAGGGMYGGGGAGAGTGAGRGAAAGGMYGGGAAAGGRGGGGMYGGGPQAMPGMGGAGRGAPAAAVKKPSDWVALKDESSGETYYYNNVTGVSQWDKPAGM